MQEFIYKYTLEDVQDGSTFFGWINLGIDHKVRKKIKLVNIKCHSIQQEQGKKSKEFITKLLDGKQIYIKTFRDRFRRWSTLLAVMWYLDPKTNAYINVNDLLVEHEFAEILEDSFGNRDKRKV